MAQINITDFIPFGRQNAVTRRRLAELTGLSDRIIRQKIEKARADGAVIINLQDGRGYFQSDNKNDIAAQKNMTAARIRALEKQKRQLEIKERLIYLYETVIDY